MSQTWSWWWCVSSRCVTSMDSRTAKSNSGCMGPPASTRKPGPPAVDAARYVFVRNPLDMDRSMSMRPAYCGCARPRAARATAGYAQAMSELIHTCYRIGDIDRSVAFYEALGFEEKRRMNIRDEAINVF